jgi:cysteine synthase A
MIYYDLKNALNAIGNTPLLDLEDGIFAKAEFLNPSGSVKDRMALYIIEKAEQNGLLKPGDTIVESTSGNTGNALSMIAAAKGYKMIVLMPHGYTHERSNISKLYGADLRLVGDFHVNQARADAIEMGKKDGFFCPQQFDNELNVEENKNWLGKEIIAQLDEQGIKIDAIVQGVGTGGTLLGNAMALKEWHNPELKVFAMEPSESRTIECCMTACHNIEGISDGFIPTIYERHGHMVDELINIDSEEAIRTAMDFATNRGLMVGPSSGANYLAALEIKRRHPEVKTVLTFLCDKGEKYLSLFAKKIDEDAA